MTVQKNKWVKQQQPKAHRSWVENPMTSLKDMCLLSHFSSIWLFVTLWTIAQAPLSMGFSRQEYWSGLRCPPPGNLPNPGMEPVSLMSPALADGFFIFLEGQSVPYTCGWARGCSCLGPLQGTCRESHPSAFHLLLTASGYFFFLQRWRPKALKEPMFCFNTKTSIWVPSYSDAC